MTAQAQLTNIATGLQFPYDAALYGNDLYITELGADRVVKIDITAAIPAPIEIPPNIAFLTCNLSIKKSN